MTMWMNSMQRRASRPPSYLRLPYVNSSFMSKKLKIVFFLWSFCFVLIVYLFFCKYLVCKGMVNKTNKQGSLCTRSDRLIPKFIVKNCFIEKFGWPLKLGFTVLCNLCPNWIGLIPKSFIGIHFSDDLWTVLRLRTCYFSRFIGLTLIKGLIH